MAITFSAANANSTNGGGSLTVSTPGGAATGDYMLAIICQRSGSGGTIAAQTPANWTQEGIQRNSTTVLGAAIFSRVIPSIGSEPSTHGFDFGASGKGSAVLIAFRAGSGFAITKLGQNGQANASAANIAIPAIGGTPTGIGMRIAIACKAHDAAHSQITSWTLDANADTASGGGGATTRTRASAQYRAEDAYAATTVVSTTAAVSVGFQIVLGEEAIVTTLMASYRQKMRGVFGRVNSRVN